MNAQRNPHAGARANTLVLVTAILVLLVIIATAFLVRSQSGRAQAAAQQKSVARESRVDTIAADIAQEVADALFVKRIDRNRMPEQVAANRASGLVNAIANSTMKPGSALPPLPFVVDNGENLARSDFPRLPPEPLAIRYGVDYFDFFDNRTLSGDPALGAGMLPVREDGYLDGYNFAPYSVFPFTNWPARYGSIPGEGNPVGNPGFGDTRWLASTEPVRARLRQQDQNPVAPAPPNPQVTLPFTADWGNLALNGIGSPILDPEGLGFSHWPHLSWIATAENGFRVAWNIANLEGIGTDFLGNEPGVITGTPGTVGGELALGIPYEQWLPYVAPREPTILNKDPATGFLVLDRDNWRLRVREWFNVGITNLALNAVGTHEQVTKGVEPNGAALPGPAAAQRRAFALPNFLQLGAFGTPADEFKVVTAGTTTVPTSRNLISRTFADADGDGWTDSFWFLAPSSSDRGTRQLVAVRIIDNSAMINVNTATRFERTNTIGATPSDVALATRRESYDETLAAGNAAGFRDPIVGFFNARENDPEYRVNFAFRTLLPPPAAAPALNADRLVYAVADNGATPAVPTGGVDVGWAPERWEGRRLQPGVPTGSTSADPYQPGFLRLLGLVSEGAAGQANAVLPFFSTVNEYALNGVTSLYGDAFVLTRPSDRLSYFKAMANGGEIVDPVTAARITSLTPFGTDDEIELRASNGLNNAQTISRLEIALNGSSSLTSTDVVFGQFMRSTRSREETARFFDPDDVRVQDWRSRSAWTGPSAPFAPRSGAELLLDHRRLMTTISGARNEMLPPRLWTIVDHSSHPLTVADEDFSGDIRRARPAFTRRGIDLDLDGQPDDVTGDGAVNLADDLAPYHPNIMFPGATLVQPGPNNPFGFPHRDATGDGFIDVRDFERARQRFLVDNRKIDLRRPNDEPVFDVATNSVRVATLTEIAGADGKLSADVQRVMRRALVDEENRQSYFGRPGQSTQEADQSVAATKLMIASFAANILSWRDGERRVTNVLYLDQPLHPQDSVLVPQDALGNAPITNAGFIGVEKQPFLQEVFVAYVFPKTRLQQSDIDAVVGPAGGDAQPGCPDPDNCQLGADPYVLPACTANGAGERFVVYDPADPATWPAVVFVAQLANPYNEPVNLADFELRINPDPAPPATIGGGGGGPPQRFLFGRAGPTGTKSGNIYGPDVELGPCTPEEPRTAIVFSVPQFFPNGDPFPRDAWLDFLDLRAPVTDLDPSNDTPPGQPFEPDANALYAPAWGSLETANRRGGTLLFDATSTTSGGTIYAGLDVSGDLRRWKPSPSVGGAPPANSFIELRRAIAPVTPGGPLLPTVVDRWDNELDPEIDGDAGQRFTDLLNRMFIDGGGGSLPPPPNIQCRSGSLAIDGIRIKTSDYFATWARSARQWLFDTQFSRSQPTAAPAGRGKITMDERAPRWVFARQTGTMSSAHPTTGAPAVETFVGGQEDTAGRRGHVSAANTPPDGEPLTATNSVTGINPTSLPLFGQYVNEWGELRRGKPTFFPTRIPEGTQARRYDYPAWGISFGSLPGGMALNYGEKGVSDLKFVDGTDDGNFVAPLRMFQKDADFDQVAEILDVPMWGPLVDRGGSGRTFATLPEILAQPSTSNATLRFPKFPRPSLTTNVPAYGPFPEQLNRLQIEPAQYDVQYPPGARPTLLTGIQSLPSPVERVPDAASPTRFPVANTPRQQNGIGFNARLVGGAALIDAFTIDDRGAAPFDSWSQTGPPDGQISFAERAAAEDRRVRLARNFEGKMTPGLINVNTAPIEVLRAMPQMLRLVYDDDFPIVRTSDSNPSDLNVLSTPLGRRRLLRNDDLVNPGFPPTFWPLWESSPFDLGGGTPGPGNPGSILFDYGVPAPRVRVAEAIELWRHKGNVSPDLSNNAFSNMPSYFSRGLDIVTGVLNPDASNYREWAPDTRSERGFDSLGELALLKKGAEFTPSATADGNGNGTPDVVDVMLRQANDINRNNVDDSGDLAGGVGSSWNQAMGWSVRFAGQDPYRTRWDNPSWGKGRNAVVDSALASLGPGVRWADGIPRSLGAGATQVFPLTGRTAIDKHLLVVATDDRFTPLIETNDTTNDGLNTGGLTKYTETKAYRYDHTAGDAVEQNQILKGISNIATTRSDVFTVWLRIRTIKQDRLTGQWNGTDPELIVDDSRYMMTIDRSSVDRPGEKPRIVSFVKVPN